MGQKVGCALFAMACHSLAKVVAYTLKIPKELMDVVITGESRVIELLFDVLFSGHWGMSLIYYSYYYLREGA